MTPNEKSLLEKIKGITEATVINISKETGLSLDYVRELCQGLVNRGFLDEITSGRIPIYKIRRTQKFSEEIIPNHIHPLWRELMKYVQENGGHLKMHIRFKDGLPVEAEDIRKKIKLDINYQTNKKV